MVLNGHLYPHAPVEVDPARPTIPLNTEVGSISPLSPPKAKARYRQVHLRYDQEVAREAEAESVVDQEQDTGTEGQSAQPGVCRDQPKEQGHATEQVQGKLR